MDKAIIPESGIIIRVDSGESMAGKNKSHKNPAKDATTSAAPSNLIPAASSKPGIDPLAPSLLGSEFSTDQPPVTASNNKLTPAANRTVYITPADDQPSSQVPIVNQPTYLDSPADQAGQTAPQLYRPSYSTHPSPSTSGWSPAGKTPTDQPFAGPASSEPAQKKKIIEVVLEGLKSLYRRIETILNLIRTRIPGLPSNAQIIAVIALVIAVGLLGLSIQTLLAPKEKFSTFTLPYEQNFDDVNLRRWFMGDGVWSIREAALAQTVGGEKPAQAYIPNKLIEDTPYHASVYITLKKDSRAAGLSFNAQYPNMSTKQQRVYLSRPDKNSLELVAGYMDDTGAFVNQISVPLSINTTEFRMDLFVYENTYLVQVNGQRMIDNRPLFYKNGLVGFYALGPAIFDTFKLTSTDTPNPGNMVYASDFDQVPGGAGWVPFNGQWKMASPNLVQSDPIVINAGIGYETSSFQNYTLRATFRHVNNHGAGVLFNMPSPYQINGAQVARYSYESDAFIWGYYDDQGAYVSQGFIAVPPAGTDQHVIQIYSGDISYDVFLDDAILARGVPLQSKQGNIGLVTSATSTEFSLVEAFPLFGVGADTQKLLTPLATNSTPAKQANSATASPTKAANKTTSATPQAKKATATLQTNETAVTPQVNETAATPKNINTTQPTRINKTPPPAPSPLPGGTGVYHGVFSGKLSDQNWVALSGDWRFVDNHFVQLRTDGYDFAAVYTKNTYSGFSYQVGLTQTEGTGAGLIFNMPYKDRLAGASMIRYSNRRDNALMWGYYDENGVFKSQGYAEVTPAGQDHHIIRVESRQNSYSIYLDDHLVSPNIPFGSGQNSGYVGLLTCVSSASYDEVSVDGIGAAYRGTHSTMDGFTDQRIVTGKWVTSNNSITQSVPETSDYVWNTGIMASQYTVSAKITLPKNSTVVGAGFIIHMSERGSKNNAYIVRITNGGQGVWWGSTDETGKFKGQGSAPLKTRLTSMVLKLVVDGGKINVFIDDQPIVSDIPAQLTDGWIGLVSYGGPVKFENMLLEVIQ
jgi:hypothetical protein